MIRLDKKQISILLVLTFVLLCMAGGIFFLPSVKDGFASNPEPRPHVKQRAPRLAAGDIIWETNFGGSGAETLIAAYRYLGKIYIFGNTTSRDFDFDACNLSMEKADEFSLPEGETGFAAILTENGRTTAFSLFEAPISAAKPWEKGFLVGVNPESGGKAIFVDENLAHVKSIKTYTTNKEYIKDIKLFDNMYHVVTSGTNQVQKTDYLRVWYINDLTEARGDTTVTDTWSLKYFDLMPSPDGFILFATSADFTSTYMVSAFYTQNSSASVVAHRLSSPYTVLSITPCSSGYAVAITDSTSTDLLKMSYDRKNMSRVFLYLGQSTESRLVCTGDKIKIFARLATNETKALSVDGNLENLKTDTLLENFVSLCDFYPLSNKTFYVGKTADSLGVKGESGDKTFNARFATASEDNALILPDGNGILTVCQSGGISRDVKGNFGKTDIWVCFVPYPVF